MLENTHFLLQISLKEPENTQFLGAEYTSLIFGEYTDFTIGNPLRNMRIHSFWQENTQVECWRIHSFYYRKSLKQHKDTQFLGWRILKLNVGEYTVFTIGNPLRNLRIHSFLVKNTQVECWRIHSCHYRESLKEPVNTQFLVVEYTS